MEIVILFSHVNVFCRFFVCEVFGTGGFLSKGLCLGGYIPELDGRARKPCLKVISKEFVFPISAEKLELETCYICMPWIIFAISSNFSRKGQKAQIFVNFVSMTLKVVKTTCYSNQMAFYLTL